MDMANFGLFFYSTETATSEGSIPMDEGEELYVIELDQGDGWTRVSLILNLFNACHLSSHHNMQSAHAEHTTISSFPTKSALQVRRKSDTSAWEEGFVPTSYIESALYA